MRTPHARRLVCRRGHEVAVLGRTPDGKCRACARHRDTIRHKAHHEKRQRYYRAKRLKLYNLTLAEYDTLLAAQGGVCGICGQVPEQPHLSVDHDHATGAVRGLLCVRCNSGVAMIATPALLRRAARYLEGRL